MATLSDAIEAYLLTLLEEAQSGTIELQRAELAERFKCVPSQVTYVLMTRFRPERGYLVEARRGGGGGIRISQLRGDVEEFAALVGRWTSIDQLHAEHVVERFMRGGIITVREAAIILAALHRNVLGLDLPQRDIIRARLLKAMLAAVLKPEEAH